MATYQLKIVHRGVRAGNIILTRLGFGPNQTAMLIDFDHATEINNDTFYEGGYICCSPDLLFRTKDHSDKYLTSQPKVNYPFTQQHSALRCVCAPGAGS